MELYSSTLLEESHIDDEDAFDCIKNIYNGTISRVVRCSEHNEMTCMDHCHHLSILMMGI